MNTFERDNKIYSGSSRVFIISFLFFSITYHAFSCFMKEWPLKFTHIRSCYLKQNTLLNKLHTKSHETLNGSFQTKLFYTYATIKQLFWHFHIENLDICYYVYEWNLPIINLSNFKIKFIALQMLYFAKVKSRQKWNISSSSKVCVLLKFQES